MEKKNLIIGLLLIFLIGGTFVFLFNTSYGFESTDTSSEGIGSIERRALEQNISNAIDDDASISWEFTITNQDEIDVQIIPTGDYNFTIIPSLREGRNLDISYRWKLELNYTEEKSENRKVTVREDMRESELDTPYSFNVPKGIRHFSMSIGESSTIIDADGAADATAATGMDSMCRTSDGTLHITYERSGSDLGYANLSLTDGGVWNAFEILMGTIQRAGIICNSTDDRLVYYNHPQGENDIQIRHSSDNYATGTSITDASGLGDIAINGFSAAVDGNDVVYFCLATLSGELYVMNSTSYQTAHGSFVPTSDDVDVCDIEVDESGGIFIIGSGTDADDFDIFGSPDNYTRHEIRAGAAFIAMTGMGIAIDDPNIYTAAIENTDLFFCNGTTTNLDSFNCGNIDETNAYLNADVAYSTDAGNLFIITTFDTTADEIHIFNSTDGGDTWIDTGVWSDAGIASDFPGFMQSTFPAWNNITEMLNTYWTDVAGTAVQYRNATVSCSACVPAGDSCTYTSGDWVVSCADNCNIVAPVDIISGDLILSNTGEFKVQAQINLTTGGSIINISTTSCFINLTSGGNFILNP